MDSFGSAYRRKHGHAFLEHSVESDTWPSELCHCRWPRVTFEGNFKYCKLLHCQHLKNIASIMNEVNYNGQTSYTAIISTDSHLKRRTAVWRWARQLSSSLNLSCTTVYPTHHPQLKIVTRLLPLGKAELLGLLWIYKFLV